MKEILDEVERWRESGEKVVVATVVATRRSAPRPVGTSLAVSESGKMCGSVSGGCVESDVFENAMEVMRSGEPKMLSYGITDEMAWSVGLRAAARSTSSWRPSSEPAAPSGGAQAAGRPRRAVHRRRGRGVGAKLLVLETGETLGGGVPEEASASSTRSSAAAATSCSRWTTATKVFAEWYGPPPRLFVYGAVDTAEALCKAAQAARLDGDRRRRAGDVPDTPSACRRPTC